MDTCIFCKISQKQIPSEFIYENSEVFVIRDINPKDKTHLLIIPKVHISDLNRLDPASSLSVALFEAIQSTAKMLENNHYRLQVNTGAASGQEVFHLHFHLLSSSKLKSGI
jgi:histidine triad (HIT) family protein